MGHHLKVNKSVTNIQKCDISETQTNNFLNFSVRVSFL